MIDNVEDGGIIDTDETETISSDDESPSPSLFVAKKPKRKKENDNSHAVDRLILNELSKETPDDDEDFLWCRALAKRICKFSNYQKSIFRQKVETAYFDVQFGSDSSIPSTQTSLFHNLRNVDPRDY